MNLGYEARERAAYAAWRMEQTKDDPVDIPLGLYQAIAAYGTARANLAVKARHGGIGETWQAQEGVAAAMRAVAEEFTLAARKIQGDML